MSNILRRLVAGLAAAGFAAGMAGCGGGGGSSSTPPPTTYALTVSSTTPNTGVAMIVTPADNNSLANGTTSFSRTYNAGATVTVTAPASASGSKFKAWTGCTSASGATCTATMNASMTVTAAYTAAVTSVTVTPSPVSVTIGGNTQFSATVNGSGVTDSTVTWSVSAPTGDANSPGTISKTGMYVTPFPAPATATVTATSNQDTTVAGSVTVTLQAPAAAAGPALTVDLGAATHPINPYIYGMNAFSLNSAIGKTGAMTIDRWGGDATSRYNYKLDVTNSASDWYYENNGAANPSSNAFDQQVASDAAAGSKTIGTVPVLGWVAKDNSSCSFPLSLYPTQFAVDPYGGKCGNGQNPDQTNITGNDPKMTSTAIDGPTWASGWVSYLVGKFGTAAKGGVAVYDLDNEPTWWNAVHHDVHPVAFTYDEVTDNGVAVAKAIKAADPTAEVSGPVIDFWWAYFYSKKDIEAGWGAGPCYQAWQNPIDRNAHGGAPLIEYYLQKFKAAQDADAGHTRFLDYVDLHTYFAANNAGLNVAGDTAEQQARLNSTRALWDPTYTDPNFVQPNYKTDTNYTVSCTVPLQAPQAIRMMKDWVSRDYPGTKTAITEYNWGGQENVNGAVAQADVLGIFGREGLDIGTLWGPPDPSKQQTPGLMAFELYRNYDGKGAMFGDESLTATSVDQGKLAVYAAVRSKDNMVTLMVINKTYGDLTTTLSLKGLPAATTAAQAYLYSNANFNGIVARPGITVTPGVGGAASTLSSTFPAQSITLIVVPD